MVNSSLEGAPTANEYSKEWKRDLLHLVYGNILPIICLVGFVGNLINLIVLSNWRKKVVMIRYLLWMSVSDILVMIFVFSYCVEYGFGVRSSSHNIHAARYYYQAIFVLVNTFTLASISLVLLITIERFVAIWSPLKARTFFTHRGSTPLVISVVLLALPFCVLQAFEYQVVKKPLPSLADELINGSNLVTNSSNDLASGSWKYVAKYNKDIFGSELYRFYTYTRVILYQIVCIVLVFVLNVISSIQYHRMLTLRRRISVHNQSEERGMDKQERYLRVMLSSAVLVYTVCLTPMAIKFFLESAENHRYKWFQIFTATANTLEVANSGLNFYLYCASSREFRRQCKKIFGNVKLGLRQQLSGKHDEFNMVPQRDHGTFLDSTTATKRRTQNGFSMAESTDL